MRRAILTILCLGLLLLAALPVHAAKRVALVIGNDAYRHLPVLEKAVNDARAVAAALEQIGFEVIAGENLTRRQTNERLAAFLATIAPGDQAFLFFAGHGLAIEAENFLIPTDMPKPPTAGGDSLVRDEAYAVDALVRRVQARGATTALFVLDACRDNPFATTGVRSIGASRGLTRIDTPKGVFVLFSAGIGQTALDRLGDNDTNANSVFTRKLVPLMKTPGITHVALAKRVQQEVDELAATISHAQQPAYYDQIIGEITLSPGDSPAASGPLQPHSDEFSRSNAKKAPAETGLSFSALINSTLARIWGSTSPTSAARPSNRIALALVADSPAEAVGAPLQVFGDPNTTFSIARDLTLPGDLQSIAAGQDSATGQPIVLMEMTMSAIERINQGNDLVGRQLALVLDGRTVLGAAILREPLSRNVMLSGYLSADEIQRMLDAISSNQ